MSFQKMYGFGGVGLSEVQRSISELSVVGGWWWWWVGGLDKRTSWSDLHRVRQKTLSERLKEPIKVKKDNRSSQTNINSFRNQFLTMKKKASRLQREVGSEPDFVIIMKNNLQDPKTSNASAGAGKYLICGEGQFVRNCFKVEFSFF